MSMRSKWSRTRRSLPLLAAALLPGCATTSHEGGTVTLVRDGRPAASIIIADQPDRIPLEDIDPKTRKPVPLTVAHAAGELQRFIEKATGGQAANPARLPGAGGRDAAAGRAQRAKRPGRAQAAHPPRGPAGSWPFPAAWPC